MTILKEYRINNELTQEQMADKLHCNLNSYRKYERGKQIMSQETLLEFLKLRGCESDIRLSKVLEEILYRR